MTIGATSTLGGPIVHVMAHLGRWGRRLVFLSAALLTAVAATLASSTPAHAIDYRFNDVYMFSTYNTSQDAIGYVQTTCAGTKLAVSAKFHLTYSAPDAVYVESVTFTYYNGSGNTVTAGTGYYFQYSPQSHFSLDSDANRRWVRTGTTTMPIGRWMNASASGYLGYVDKAAYAGASNAGGGCGINGEFTLWSSRVV